MNSADFGNLAYGADAAARAYFGKPATQLSLAQSAALAALVKAPAIDPAKSPQIVEDETNRILKVMLEEGMISPVEHSEASAERLNFHKQRNPEPDLPMPASKVPLAPPRRPPLWPVLLAVAIPVAFLFVLLLGVSLFIYSRFAHDRTSIAQQVENMAPGSSFPVPRPDDFNTPGEMKPEDFAPAQREVFTPPPPAQRPSGQVPSPGQPGAVPMRGVGVEFDPHMPVHSYAPIQEIGSEVTYHLVDPDNRPALEVPLSGPGAYQITVIRRGR